MFKICRGIYKSHITFKGGVLPRYLNAILTDRFSVTYFEQPKGGGQAYRVVLNLYQDGEFYTGLAILIKRVLRELGYNVKTVNDNSYYSPDATAGVGRVLNKLNANLRDYQAEAVGKSAGKPLTLISLPTGTGKTVVMAAMLLADDLTTLIVVDSQVLMGQLADDIRYLTGVECGIVGGGVFAPRVWTVAVIDSLLTGRGRSLVQGVEAVYFDEAHKSGANSYKTLVDIGCKNLLVRRGFSGTTYRNDHRSLLLPALSGPITMHKTTSKMIDLGWLAVPHISMPIVSVPDLKHWQKKWYHRLYSKAIVQNEFRNDIGTQMLAEHARLGNLSIGLFRNVREHLPLLRSLLYSRTDKKRVGIIHGGIPLSRRRRVLEQFAEHEKTVLLASCGTIGEGIDLPGETKFGVNFVGGCSEIMVRQMLGRILRKPKQGGEIDPTVPFHVHYIDFLDKTHEEMQRQAEIRHDIYASETAFDVEKFS